MGSFAVNVLASVIGGTLLLIIAGRFSRKARWVLIGVLSRLLDVDIDYVFRDKKECEDDMRKEIQLAKWICVFAGRGNELQRDTFNSVFGKQPSDRLQSVRILLPQTSVPADQYNWLAQREQELAMFDPAYGDGLLVTQVKSNLTFLKSYIKSGRIELRSFNTPNIARIVLTDRCLYYTPYRKDAHGRHSRVYKFRRHCEMYENMLRFFEQIWGATTKRETQDDK